MANKWKNKTAKNPHAVALGRLGGLKGGKARMAKMTAEERSEFAKKGARARHGQPNQDSNDSVGMGLPWYHRGFFGKEFNAPIDRVDWMNRARQRKESVFGVEFYQSMMRERLNRQLANPILLGDCE